MTSPTPNPVAIVRATKPDDLPAIARIFQPEVEMGTASWAYEAPTNDEMIEKYERLVAINYPWLTATIGDEVVGFSFGSPYRPREGYRFLVENSIYVDQRFRGRGLAQQLMTVLIEECTALGFRQMIAVIGDSNNLPSIALHRRMGFELVGLLPDTGYKFDRWLDSVLMQRSLGDGNSTLPAT